MPALPDVAPMSTFLRWISMPSGTFVPGKTSKWSSSGRKNRWSKVLSTFLLPTPSSKKYLLRHNIPTAAYREFDGTNYAEGIAYIQQHPLPIVLKADGLAAGKGVIICQTTIEAVAEFELMLQGNKFGKAGNTVVVEEFLTGIELSLFVLTDGRNFLTLPEAKDYKRGGEGEQGPNTGGMGAVSHVPFADATFME